ncbi:hypothetical protein [Devosia marina]|uniref:Uncharacterized protein n=1 Tax=Devosia marina TaxID=2683198 RepID=A0A7X3FNY0_9HYPH|nr:hypothetical protein [Devosia marina]MVS97906.1 hypothetical protein [Devosia marina]
MANAFSTDANASGKSYSSFMPYSPPALVAGLVQHELVAGPTQLTILRIVDETGSASLGDIAEGLGDHPDPTGAVLVMVDLEILVIDYTDVIDQHSVVRRAPETPGPVDAEAEARRPSTFGCESLEVNSISTTTSDAALPTGIEQLATSPLVPTVVVAAGEARRGLGKLSALNRPGIYALIGERQVYVGASASVGTRVASGQQPIGDIKHIVVITDTNDTLCDEDARAAERMLFARIEATRAFAVMNELPMGAAIDAQRYSELDGFLGRACLALRHHGVMFTHGAARAVLSGPRQEAGRVAPLRPFNEMPDGTCMELCFDNGLVALAARQSDNRWIVLEGSDIRIETAASANSSVRFLRSAWLHAGLLELSADGRSFVTTRDLVFSSGSGAAQFCVGSKGRTRDSWVAIDPDGGIDPATPALIAA